MFPSLGVIVSQVTHSTCVVLNSSSKVAGCTKVKWKSWVWVFIHNDRLRGRCVLKI